MKKNREIIVQILFAAAVGNTVYSVMGGHQLAAAVSAALASLLFIHVLAMIAAAKTPETRQSGD